MSSVIRHCTCMSGLTETQAALLVLNGGIQGLEPLLLAALFAVAGPAPLGDPAVHSELERLRLGLARAAELCRRHGWPGGAP